MNARIFLLCCVWFHPSHPATVLPPIKTYRNYSGTYEAENENLSVTVFYHTKIQDEDLENVEKVCRDYSANAKIGLEEVFKLGGPRLEENHPIFNVLYNHGHKFRRINIGFLHMNHNENCFSCISIDLTPNISSYTEGSWQAIIALQALETLEKAKITVFGETNQEEIFKQSFYLWTPRICGDDDRCEDYNLGRFVYNDENANSGLDTLHIGEFKPRAPLEYQLELLTPEDNWTFIRSFYDDRMFIEKLPSSVTKFYRVTSKTRTYRSELVASSIVVVLLLIAGVIFLLWFSSIPRRRKLVVVYCQCSRHSIIANALKQLLRFMEKNCYMQFEEPNESNGQEEGLLHSKGKPDFVVFVPFPAIPNHDRLCEAEVHQICDRYKATARKIELYLPLESELGLSPTSDWPRNTFANFKLLEELSKFVKYVHPFYYPACLERIFRRQLWGPHLESLLALNTYTNDHIREIANPRLCPVFLPPPEVVVSNIDLAAVIAEAEL